MYSTRQSSSQQQQQYAYGAVPPTPIYTPTAGVPTPTYAAAAAAGGAPTPTGTYGSPTATSQFVSPPRRGSNYLELPSTRAGGQPQYYAAPQQQLSQMLASPSVMPSSQPSRGPAEYTTEDGQNLEYLPEPPEGLPSTDVDGNKIRYVEVPVVEEVIRHVPRYEQVYVDKFVPRYEEVWVDRVVEVPEMVVQEKFVDLPVVEEVLRHVPKKEIVDVEKEVIKKVPRIETVLVEKVKEVPGEVVVVPVTYTVERPVYVPRVIDKQVPVLVAQLVQPMLTGLSDDIKEVTIPTYQPKFHVVDVPVARPLPSALINNGVLRETCRVVQVPAGQYNTILRHMNRHLDCPDKQMYLPYVPDPDTQQVGFLEGDVMPEGGPVAVPMPLLNSPQPAYAGAKIAAPSVPDGTPAGAVSPVYPHGFRDFQATAETTDRDLLLTSRSARHHGKPRSQRSTRHAAAQAAGQTQRSSKRHNCQR